MKEINFNKKWHSITAEDALAAFGADIALGLSEQEASDRLNQFGPNELTRKKGQGTLARFLMQFNQSLMIIMIVAAVITFFLNEHLDSAVIFGVVLVNAVFGFIQESKALKAIEALARAMTSEATVLRGGEKRRLPSGRLAPGDVVILQSGDKVPADMRLLKTRELQIDESTLTGESVPAHKDEKILREDIGIGDRRNMAYSSTLVTFGIGTGLVIATGDRAEIGHINKLIASADVLETPLTKKIHQFSGLLLYVILGLAAFTFAVGFFRGYDLIDMFMASIALAVGAIPEGLPAVITITLAIGVSRMAKRNAIIRKLPAVETLGSTMIICSDKTGTLTQNQMTVQDIFAGGVHYSVGGTDYAPDGEINALEGPNGSAGSSRDSQGDNGGVKSNRALQELLKAGLLCNDSKIIKTGDGWRVEGDPTEGALIVSAMKGGYDLKQMERELPRLDTIPFESERQYMATLHDQGPGKLRVIYVKGSVESICVKCGLAAGVSGRPEHLSREPEMKWIDSMAVKGQRILAFARKEVPADKSAITHADVQQDLEFLGLQGMIDPPRPEAISAIGICHKAGVRVKMITGDHAGTAAAIARQLGLCGPNCSYQNREVITGQDIDALDDSQLADVVDHTAVFARVSPEQKLRLVRTLQSLDYVVAMTGDGVNDAPALRQANIGVAMGITGTEVSKEAADMVLTDDNFASIEAAVEEGRGVFDNLVKFITWTLPTNAGEGMVILLAILLGTALPVLPLQILWINLTTSLLLGLMLAFDPKEPGIMNRPPRDPKTPILTSTMIIRILMVSALLVIGAFGCFNLVMLRNGGEILARTLAVNVFVFGEMFYLFNCRSLTRPFWQVGVWSNKIFWFGVLAMALLQLAYIYLPVFNKVFQSAPMGAGDWTMVIGVALIIFLVVELEKWVRYRSKNLKN